MAITRSARAATCGDVGPLAPTGPTMRNLYDKIALTDEGLAEARTPISSLSGTPTALHAITAPGVYYLTSNITGTPGMSAIEVLADNVEIECDGFLFLGGGGSGGSCIRTPNPQRCIGIYDAGFSHWPDACIDLSNSSDCYVEECWFDSCDASSNSLGLGACTLGAGGIIDDCNVLACTSGRLVVGPNGVIEECVSRDSTGGCFYSPGPAVMEDNFALGNTGPSIVIDLAAVVIGNRVYLAGGMDVGNNSVVAENDITDCLDTAIFVRGSNCNVEENHVSGGIAGIVVAAIVASVMVDGNHVAGCSGTPVTVQAGATRCFVVRNSVSPPLAVPGYSIAAGNTWGPIVNAIGVGDLGALGTITDPLSNFVY